MARFRYRAVRTDGTVAEGWTDADSEDTVRTQVEAKGWLLLNAGASRAGGPLWTRGRLSPREFLVFNQEFLALLKAGLPVLKVFDLLAERVVHQGFRTALQGVRSEIRGGASISEAMARHQGYFPDLYRASLRSGEQAGTLVEVLQRAIAYQKLLIAVREKVAKAMAYPAFLVVASGAVVAFLLVYVMPTFSEIYGQNRAALPVPTQLLLTAVERLTGWLPWFLAGGAALAVLLHRWARTPAGRMQLDRLSLRLPLIGDILLKNQVIRMARTLSVVLAGGLPLLTALQITGGAVTNRLLARGIASATDRVREGVSLAVALREMDILPSMTLEMIAVGEATGSLEAMLQDVAEFHEGELDLRLNQLTTWIEPALLLFMGILIGGIVIVMYLPVFQIAGTV